MGVPAQAGLFDQASELDTTRPGWAEWAELYVEQLVLPRHERKDRRELHELSQDELFALPAEDVEETIKQMVAEAEFLGRASILGYTDDECAGDTP